MIDADLQELLKEIIENLSSEWIYNCDGGCYWEIAQRKVIKKGPYTFIQQPKKGFPEQETEDISLMIQGPKDNFEETWASVKAEQDACIEKILVQTQNRWMEPFLEANIETFLHIQPWTFVKDRWKTTQVLRGGCGKSCGDWSINLKEPLDQEFIDKLCLYEIGTEYEQDPHTDEFKVVTKR